MKPIVLLLLANITVLAGQAQTLYRTISTTDLVRMEDPSATESVYLSQLTAIGTNTGTLLGSLDSSTTTQDLYSLIDEIEAQQNQLNETSQQLQNITDEYDASLQLMSGILKTLHDTTTSILRNLSAP